MSTALWYYDYSDKGQWYLILQSFHVTESALYDGVWTHLTVVWCDTYILGYLFIMFKLLNLLFSEREHFVKFLRSHVLVWIIMKKLNWN